MTTTEPATQDAPTVTAGRIVLDGQAIPFQAGDSVAVAILRAGEHPGRGGTLCLAGDCGNCVATVDGIAYTRTCEAPAMPGLRVTRHPEDGLPPLPLLAHPDATSEPPRIEVRVERRWVDVCVIGGGETGRREAEAAEASGRSTLLLDAHAGQEVVAIYAGPTVIARTPSHMLHVHAAEVVVATGSAELQPAVPGNELAGIVTARAAAQLEAAGVDLGRIARVGPELVRFEADTNGRIAAVVTHDEAGREIATACETAVVDLGLAPRDVLARMAAGDGVRVVGSAAVDHPLPAAPTEGVVCRCMNASVDDLAAAWDKGFTELELLKRSSLACLGFCQGGACLPQVRAWIAARANGEPPPPFTARPASRQITLAEAAAETELDAFRRTPLHEEHLALGARLDRFGGWWRPWHYGDAVTEYWAVREAVSVGDVSTLGKLVVSGPDVVEVLERIYPCRVADIKPGRSRYALLLNERGHVIDDGMILRESEMRFVLTFTSGGAANAEMWIRDWIETWGLRVHVMDRTMSLAAINVTGPLARTLLARAGLLDAPSFLGHVHADIAGVPCHVMRLSFTGEASFELHHPLDGSVRLWRRLLELGADLGIRPHGLQALFGLRLEKGHVIVGMDTELDSSPRRLNMDWAARMDKPFFVGKAALERTAKLPDERRLFGFTMQGPAPTEGSPIRFDGQVVGHVSGSWLSPLLGKAVMLGWQKRAPFVDRVEIDGREATVTPPPFYDPEGHRARA